MMDIQDVMQAYNGFERKRVNPFNGGQVSSEGLVKFVSADYHGSYIAYFNLDNDCVEGTIQAQIDYFSARQLSFEWKTYSTDTPSNMGELLVQQGFEQEETESFMVLDLATTENREFDDAILTEVFDEQGIRDAIRVQEQVWGGDFEWQYEYLLKLKTHSPESISIYVVYVGGEPVTSAWLTFNGNSPFAGIWGGSTVEAFRGKGYYSVLLNKRIAEAKARGLQYLVIDASNMSKPIVEKRGFQVVATTTGYTFTNRELA